MNRLAKLISLALCLVLLLSFSPATAETQPKGILLLVPRLGDGSYFDATKAGIDLVASMYPGITADVIEMGGGEMGADHSNFNPFFTDAAASGKYDLIVTCGAECTGAMMLAAQQYPEQKFFSADLQKIEDPALSNVYGVCYSVADMGYLAGYLASKITVSDMPLANADKKVGIILGVDVPGLNEFAGSFCTAAIANGVQVYIDYTGDFIPSFMSVAQDKAAAMYADGVDVIWQVSGGSGLGVFAAAAAANRYSFGVDADQTLTVTDDAQRATIVTSFFKAYDQAVVNAYKSVLDGTFPGGKCIVGGLAEGIVGLADNDQYKAMVPETIRAEVASLGEKVAAGEIEIFSVEADPDGWVAIKQQATAPLQ
ncbi:MAG: BMP family ABC transporter substrate-binding protein [Clostridia bacterium]|nr:BMP family ABC transporter substrate-binding protein [Clostridia bacterium]